jgi:hypothetical protein
MNMNKMKNLKMKKIMLRKMKIRLSSGFKGQQARGTLRE